MTRPPATAVLFLPSLESPEPEPPALCEQPADRARARAIRGPTSFIIWRGTIARRPGSPTRVPVRSGDGRGADQDLGHRPAAAAHRVDRPTRGDLLVLEPCIELQRGPAVGVRQHGRDAVARERTERIGQPLLILLAEGALRVRRERG